jgi:hypothetical protein
MKLSDQKKQMLASLKHGKATEVEFFYCRDSCGRRTMPGEPTDYCSKCGGELVRSSYFSVERVPLKKP